MAEEGSGGKWWHPFRWLGQIGAALSMLNLIRDLQWISLKGVLGTWIETYDHMVKSITRFLFGWIHVSWMQISAAEAHLIVIILILTSAGAKAWVDGRDFGAFVGVAATVALFGAIAAAVALIVPGWGGVAAVLILLAFLVSTILFVGREDPSIAERDRKQRRAALVNIGVVLGVVAVTVIGSKVFDLA